MGTFQLLLFTQVAFGLISFTLLNFITAPYGRFVRAGWGPALPARWAWFIMELPAVMVILYIFIIESGYDNVVCIIFITLWEVHYIQRTFLYPFKLKGGKKPFPVVLIGMAILFNTLNGYLNGAYIFDLQHYPLEWLWDVRFISGLVVFITGYIVNRQSDLILNKLRNDHQDYRIPEKGLFRYVSNPHYLGEIIEWTGWAILTWSPAGLAFAIFTIANLAPRAKAHHVWYLRRFKDYPRERKILVPFLW